MNKKYILINWTYCFFIIIFFSIATNYDLCAQELAFPGAEGFGALSQGGRGGRVIKVTSLKSFGPGSLREACRAKGPRIVIFCVGGTIDLKEVINIPNPFITIAGQTAPGDGICLKGAGLNISTHDVIVRGLRIRIGDSREGPDPDNRDGIDISNNNGKRVFNVIIDHCSISWAIDENISTWYQCNDITIQWCIISETLENSLHPLGAHSRGLLIGDHSKRISIHHNLLAHNNRRNPLLKGDTESEIFNNVVYNWGKECIHFADDYNNGPQLSNIIGNYFQAGPQSDKVKPVKFHNNVKDGTKVFLGINFDSRSPSLPNGSDTWALSVQGDKKTSYKSEVYVVASPTITIQPPVEAYNSVLKYAGAITPKRDLVDERIIQEVETLKGKIISSQKEVGSWPVYAETNLQPDADHDGIIDTWEFENGLDHSDPIDGKGGDSPEGSTNIVKYINSFFTSP